MTPGDALLTVAAGLGAGLVNGMAGGGSLVSYPALLATGHTALVANVTNSVGILPGYVGGALGFRSALAGQRQRVRGFLPVAVVGGLVGAGLLLVTPEDVFDWVAPILIVGACLLFALQPLLARRLADRRRRAVAVSPATDRLPAAGLAAVLLASVYGGYFGAGLGVIYLAVLGAALADPLHTVNSLRSVLSLAVNAVAVALFAVAAEIDWGAVGVLAATSLVGGYVGARTALKLPTQALRGIVLIFGTIAVWRLLAT